jgi:hypothetical protein
MVTTIAILMGVIALAALVMWILAIRVSYSIERIRHPDAPRRLVFTNIIASLFISQGSGEAEIALRRKLRRRLFASLACFIILGGLSFALPLLPAYAQPAGPELGPVAALNRAVAQRSIGMEILGAFAIVFIIAFVAAFGLAHRIERCADREQNAARRRTNPGAKTPRLAHAADARVTHRPRKQPWFASSLAIATWLAFGAACGLAKSPNELRGEDAIVAARASVGTTFFYTRSNQDGSKPERVTVHIARPNELHVAKSVSPCTDAAYVTATFDVSTREATRMVGGRLRRDLTQDPQAFLELDPASRRLLVRFGDPASPSPESFEAPVAPWRMYDFDLADFVFSGPPPQANFTFGLAMAWPDGTLPVLRILGQAQATFLYARSAGDKLTYRVGGTAFTGPNGEDLGGELILDGAHGYVVEARLGRPNHPGYDDFMLKLDKIALGEEGRAAWRSALASHWSDCPA